MGTDEGDIEMTGAIIATRPTVARVSIPADQITTNVVMPGTDSQGRMIHGALRHESRNRDWHFAILFSESQAGFLDVTLVVRGSYIPLLQGRVIDVRYRVPLVMRRNPCKIGSCPTVDPSTALIEFVGTFPRVHCKVSCSLDGELATIAGDTIPSGLAHCLFVNPDDH